MKKNLFFGAFGVALMMSASAMAQTSTVTNKVNTVHPDGSVTYQSQTVVKKGGDVIDPAVMPVVTFYYYEPQIKSIVSGYDLTPDVIELWDTDHNGVIDNHEFYTNAMIMYEPMEYSKRTYQDINADGIPDLTKEEYTVRLQQLPLYATVNTDGKDGLTLYEFTGVGFQDADIDNDNQVTIDEIRAAFYHQKGLAPKPEKINP